MLTPVRPDEAALLLAHYQSMIGLPGCTWNEYYPSAEDVAHDIAAGAVYALRDDAGQIIAAASTEEDEIRAYDFCADKAARSIEISRVMVVRTHQGQGLARQVVSQLIALLRAEGYAVVRLLVSPGNVKAYHLYTSMGFQVIGECDLYDEHWACCELWLT